MSVALTSKELIARLPADVQSMVQAKKAEILQQLAGAPIPTAPPVEPAVASVVVYPDDVARLVAVANAAGYRVSPCDAGEIWRLYSEGMRSNWLAPESWSDAEILKVMTRYGVAIDRPANRPAPPNGYATWLDYAVDCMDTRSIEIEMLFEESGGGPTQDDMRQAVKAELEELRRRAGL